MTRILLPIVIILLIAVVCGCCNPCGLNDIKSSTYTINSGSYIDEKVNLENNTVLSYQVAATDGEAYIYIANETSFRNFQDNPPNIHYLKHDLADSSCSGTFEAPAAGTYYFMVSNHGTKPISVAVVLTH